MATAAKRLRGLLVLSAALAVAGAAEARAGEDSPAAWPQWGGPSRDFHAPAAGLATSWPEDGPEILWRRALGEGYSAILFEDGRLYTLYRVDEKEAVVALDAGSGETVWEYRYEQRTREKHLRQFGEGPSSTPLIAGDLLFTIGVAGKMHALDKSDGRVVWSRDLWGEDLGGNFLGNGYASSPVAYRDTVIVPVGGAGAGLVAFDQESGSVRWKASSFKNSYSSPLLLHVAGEDQLVVFMAEELIGVDPASGELRWRYPHVNEWRHNINMPALVGEDRIFLSSPQAGSRGLRLVREGEAMRVEEVWSTRRVQLYHVSSVLIGDWVYGSTGTGLAFMTAVNVRTGEVAWRERGFAKANCVEADGKLVILDEDGVLYLASATPERLVVHAQVQLLDRVAWTVPTIVGKTLYARDRKQILAVDLGSSDRERRRPSAGLPVPGGRRRLSPTEGVEEEGPRFDPVAARGALANPQHLADFSELQAEEVAQLHHPGQPLVARAESVQGLVESEELGGAPVGRHLRLLERHHLGAAAALGRRAAARPVDQDLAHGQGRDGQEVVTVAPVRIRGVRQPQIGLVDQLGGVEHRPRRPPSELAVGGAPELVVDEGHELPEGVLFAGAQGREELADFAAGGGRHLGHRSGSQFPN